MSIDVLTPDRIAMSQRERDVLKIMHDVLKGERTQAEAAELLGVNVRTVKRRWLSARMKLQDALQGEVPE